ncbi:MAG: YceI family protein [Sandaracinaceae bacterium]
MPQFDASSAECQLFTFKEGLLSAVAHDLELSVRTFELQLEDDYSGLSARFDTRSIRVIDAIVDGRRSSSSLSAKDKTKIESNVLKDVLPTKRGTEAVFASTSITAVDAGWEIRGTLKLNGREKELAIPVFKNDGKVIGEVTLHQPDFGIKPYSAMLGALKIQPDVKVRVTCTLPE